METATKIRDPDVKLKSFPFPNGESKKPHRTTPPPPPPTTEADEVLYRECLKNHAASLGGHALDGCGEFMPSLSANPADPTSLKCAACGCHRNFHRRIAVRPRAPHIDDALEGEGEREGQDDEEEEEEEEDDSRRKSLSFSLSPTPPPHFSSAPHMLLALSSGVRDADSGKLFAIPSPVASATPLRKRFRTRFSPEQKDRMLELSERLGWRLQKRDEELVERCCGEIGVGKGVFKVWMHNNKHHLFGQSGSLRGEPMMPGGSPSAAAAGSGGGGGGGGGGVHDEVDGNGNAMNGAC